MHLLSYVVKCTVTDSPFNTQASCSKCPPSAWIYFLTGMTRELVPYEALQRCWWFAGVILFSCSSADMCSRLQLCRWINSTSHMIHNILFTDEAHFTAMESTKQETLIYGIVIIFMELSKVTTNIAFPLTCGVVSMATNWLVRTFSRNVWQVIFTPNFCKMNCQHSFLYKHVDRCTTSMTERRLISVRS